MSIDSCSVLGNLVLDLGMVQDDIPRLIPEALPAKELTLKEMWDELNIGTKIPMRMGSAGDKKLKPGWLTYEQTHEALEKYDTLFWVPQSFHGAFHADVKRLKGYTHLVVDLDPKIDPQFWSKMTDVFLSWKAGNTVLNIPIPTYYSLSGTGAHLYWKLKTEFATNLLKALATVALKLIILKLSSLFERPLDQIHIVQAFRVTESKTKHGDICRTFKVINGTADVSLRDFVVQCLDDGDKEYVDLFLDRKVKYSELWGRLEPYANAAGLSVISKSKKRNKTVEKLLGDEPEFDFGDCPVHEVLPELQIQGGIDAFDPRSIGVFSTLIDQEPSCVRKMFAKKIVFSLKSQAPINEGFRNNRLFGASVGFAKCGCTRDFIIRIVYLLNQKFCGEPLSEKDLYNCYVRPHRYLRATEAKMREWLGIDHWAIFVKRESTMTRKKAARNASTKSHKDTVRKLRDGYASLGFDVSISELCRQTGVSRQTYNRYKNSGILTQEVFGYFINNANFDQARLRPLVEAMRYAEKHAKSVLVSEPQVADQYVLAMTSEQIADAAF